MRILKSTIAMLAALALSLAIVPEAAMTDTSGVCGYPTAEAFAADGADANGNGVCVVLALVETTVIGDGKISPEGNVTSELGEDVTLTFTPSQGHCLAEVIVDGKSVGRPASYTFEKIDDSHKLTARFIPVPGCSRGADCPSIGLFGVPVEAWFHEAADTVLELGMMRPMENALFGQDVLLTREMLVEALYALDRVTTSDEPRTTRSVIEHFDDIDEADACHDAVNWAVSAGIITGYPDNTFRPANSVTREELAVMLYRYAQTLDLGFKGLWMFRLDYPDIANISDWAYEALCWCTMKNVCGGYPDGTLAPQGTATRAEAAAMLERFCGVLSAQLQ